MADPIFPNVIFADQVQRSENFWLPLEYYLWGAVKDKCYADKPETIDSLKHNILKDIGEIQLHATNNVLKS